MSSKHIQLPFGVVRDKSKEKKIKTKPTFKFQEKCFV